MTRIGGFGWVFALWLLAGCYSATRDAEADTSTSWLQQCTVQTDCAAGTECVDGWCTMPGADAQPPPNTDSQPAQSAEPQPPPSVEGQPPAAPAGAPAQNDTDGQGDGIFDLRDVNLEGSIATVGWQADRGLVSWVSGPTDALQTQALHLARVSIAGDIVEEHSAPFATSWPDSVHLTIAGDGRVGAAVSGVGCRLDVFEPDLQTKFVSVGFPCTGDGSEMIAAAVPSSSDWLIAYGTGLRDEGDQFRGSIVAGRYGVESATWAAEPVELGARTEADALGVFAAGQDAVVVWGNENGSTLRSASAMAGQVDPSLPSSWSAPVTLEQAKTISDGGYGLASLAGQRLLFGMDGSTLRAHVLGPDGAVTARDVASSTISDRRPGVAAAEELGLAGVCYARGPGPYIGGPIDSEQPTDVASDSMWFVIVDASGEPVSEPVMIADGLADNTGCGVAWSGERFFAVTWGIFQEVVDNRYTLTRMRGLLVAPPGR